MKQKINGCPECGSLVEGKHKVECPSYVGPDAVYQAAVNKLTDELKKDLTPLFDKYGDKFARMARNTTDPHTPVVAVLQLALAQSAAEYLTSKGIMANIACEMVLHATGGAMNTWARSLLKQTQQHTVLHKEGPDNVQ